MDECLSCYKPLQELIENEQGLKTYMRISGNNISIIPLTDIVEGNDNFLQVTFRIDGETLILSWLYLLYVNRGTGTKIVNWLIEYCINNTYLDTLKITNVENNKIKMRSICCKLGFRETKCKDNFSDFYLKIR